MAHCKRSYVVLQKNLCRHQAKSDAIFSAFADFLLTLRRKAYRHAAESHKSAFLAAPYMYLFNLKMEILRTVSQLKAFSGKAHGEGKSVGLVPTMGALHQGHLSLMHKAVADNDVVVASVFVNPTQFNNKTDLATYPHTEDADCRLLQEAGVDAVFMPEVDEVYPPSESATPEKVYDLGEVAEVMEGSHRPGHFQGVAAIVSRLMRWSDADRAYFGEKDFQQIAVVRRMALTEGIDIEIVACPIMREADGLALSSRNVRLTPQQRAVAPGIYKALEESREYSLSHTPQQTIDMVTEKVNAIPECEVEYYSIVDADTMQPVQAWDDAPNGVQGCITVYCGEVRLIDNIRYR